MYHQLSLLVGATPPPGGPTVYLQPADNLPGSKELHGIVSGIGYWALIAAMLGIVIGAVIWAFGHFSQNYQQSVNGRKGVLVSALAAVLIGAAPYLVNSLFSQGSALR